MPNCLWEVHLQLCLMQSEMMMAHVIIITHHNTEKETTHGMVVSWVLFCHWKMGSCSANGSGFTGWGLDYSQKGLRTM